MIDSSLVMKLREMTGAGILDAKKALEDASGDVEKAIELLRKKGAIKAAKKGERMTHEGVVHCYVHANGKVGAMVELLCETDFVARNEQFQGLAHDLAMHIAAANPLYLRPEDVPPEVLEKEKEIWAAEFAAGEKPAAVVSQILEGKVRKFYSETCLLKQAFIKDEDVTVEELLQQGVAKLGENIQVKRFTRFSLGE
ncbi:MAG: translation elongation factor Ts [Patescibacteria group bacterium]